VDMTFIPDSAKTLRS